MREIDPWIYGDVARADSRGRGLSVKSLRDRRERSAESGMVESLDESVFRLAKKVAQISF